MSCQNSCLLFFVRKMKSVILRYFINWFIDVQYSVVIMYKERRCYNASTKNGYGDLVVMSMETYDELLSTNHIDKAKAGFSDPKSAIYNA